MASDQPRKLFVGGLSADTSEKALEGIFCVFGHIAEVILQKHGEIKKSRGFAFITFENSADAQCAAKEMNGKLLDGKVIKVEPSYGKPSYGSHGRESGPPISRNTVTQRRRNDGHSSSEGNFDSPGLMVERVIMMITAAHNVNGEEEMKILQEEIPIRVII